jgi:hypothetical protein
VSFARGNEVPHIFTRNARLQPAEFLIIGAKRLLQHNLPIATMCAAANAKVIGRESSFAEEQILECAQGMRGRSSGYGASKTVRKA